MTLNENTIRELLDAAEPAPWSVARLDLHRDTGVVDNEHAVASKHLAARAPELAAEYLRLRRELADFRAALQDGATNPELTSIDHSWCEAARDGIDRILNGDSQND